MAAELSGTFRPCAEHDLPCEDGLYVYRRTMQGEGGSSRLATRIAVHFVASIISFNSTCGIHSFPLIQ
jgi:hypothetical protein